MSGGTTKKRNGFSIDQDAAYTFGDRIATGRTITDPQGG
jgi:hypothetical protein